MRNRLGCTNCAALLCLVFVVSSSSFAVAGDTAGNPATAEPPSSAPLPPFRWSPSATVPETPYWRKNLFKRFFTDQKFLFTTWVPAEGHRLSFTLPLLAGSVAAATSDRGGDEAAPDLSFERTLHERVNGSGLAAAHAFTELGNGLPAAALLGTTYLFSRWAGNDRLAEASSLSSEALLNAGLWSSVLKQVTRRARPSDSSRGSFFQFRAQAGTRVDSFPSGHAMGAFAVATVFAHVYSDKRWVPWVVYSTAGLVAASRVALGRHFPSDVVVGGILGNSMGRMVMAHQEGSFGEGGSLQPIFDPAHGGVGVGYRRTW